MSFSQVEKADKFFKNAKDLQNIGSYDSSNYYLDLSSDLYWKSNDTLNYIKTLNQKGFNYSVTMQSEKALDILTKSLTISNSMGTKGLEQLSGVYHNSGIAYYIMGQYDTAILLTQKAYQLRVQVLGKYNESVSSSLNNLGILYENINKLDSALLIYERALEIQKKIYGEHHVEVANSLNNLGTNHYSRGEYQEALSYYEASKKMYVDLVGEDHKDVASIYLNIGAIYDKIGESQKALSSTLFAKNLYNKVLGPDHSYRLNVALNLGDIYASMNQPKDALLHSMEGYYLAVGMVGDEHPFIASLSQNIGTIYSDLQKYDSSIFWQNKSLDINIKIHGDSSLDVAYNYNNLGTVHLKKKQYDLAINNYLKALENKKSVLGERHSSLAISYSSLAKAYLEKKQLMKALEVTHLGVISNHPSFDNNDIYSIPPLSDIYNIEVMIELLIKKTILLKHRYDETKDIDFLLKAELQLEACNRFLTDTKLTLRNEADRLLLWEDWKRLSSAALELYYQLYRETNNEMYLDKAFHYSERSKAAVLLLAISHSSSTKYSGLPDEVVKEEETLRQNLSGLKHDLSLTLDQSYSEGHPEVVALRNELFDQQKIYDDYIADLENSYPEYYALKYKMETVSIPDAQRSALLKDKKVIIEYFRTDSVLYTFILSAKKSFFIRQDLPFDLDRNIKGLRNSIIYKVNNQTTELSYKLYKKLIQPVEEVLQANKVKAKSLIVIPDGILSYLPFELLVTNISKQGKPSYLIQKYNISNSSSVGLLHHQSTSDIKYGDKAYVAFAPVFSDGSETNFLVNTSERFVDLSRNYSNQQFVRSGKITPIPATKSEVEEIHAMHKSKNLFAKYFLFKDAKEENLKDPGLGQFKYIHLATHGFINDDNPGLSGLVMSQDSLSKEDGILYAEEIYNLDWNADLVALSACETGLGKVVDGEGIMGLSRAFMYAGAKSVLVSLWKVSDTSTSQMMVDFYTHVLEGESKPQALRKAKIKLLESEKFSSPYYWAPFVLIGN